MAEDFREILDTNMDNIERPKPLPPGSWFAIIKEHSFDKTPKQDTPYVRFTFVNLQAGEGVSSEAVDEIDDLAERNLRKDYYLTANARYRVKEMLASLGIQTEGRSLGACIADSTGAKVILDVTNTTSKDGKEIYTNVGDVRGVA